MSLPTSFRLKPQEVDKLCAVARPLFVQSREFQRLIQELEIEEGVPER